MGQLMVLFDLVEQALRDLTIDPNKIVPNIQIL